MPAAEREKPRTIVATAHAEGGGCVLGDAGRARRSTGLGAAGGAGSGTATAGGGHEFGATGAGLRGTRLVVGDEDAQVLRRRVNESDRPQHVMTESCVAVWVTVTGMTPPLGVGGTGPSGRHHDT